MSGGRPPLIWVLLGHRRGDNYQVLALAQGLGLPFETRSLRYNILRRLDNRILGRSLVSVLPSAARSLQPPWPDLVIGIGRRSVPVARYIRHASGGKAKLVQLGNPRIDPNIFDLIITLPQYSVDNADHVVRLPLAMAGPHSAEAATDDEIAFLEALPRPHRLMVIGGPNKHWYIPPDDAADAARALVERCGEGDGTLIAIGSPRTKSAVLDAVGRVIAGTRHRLVLGRVPRYFCLLQDADEIHVTADSVSMLSEAVFTGRPVGLIPIRETARGKLATKLANLGLRKLPVPNLRAFWKSVLDEGLVGSPMVPQAACVQDPTEKAAAAVRRLLGFKS